MSATLDKIKKVMPSLPPEELREVRELADSLLSEVSEDEVERELEAQGAIRLPSAPRSSAPRPAPINVPGRPLSETIIEERR